MRHVFFVALAVIFAVLAFQVPMRLWQQAAPYLFILGIVLLVLVLVPGVGREVNGSRRWISLYVVNFQPSELMKVCCVLYAADYTVRKAAFMHSLRRGFMPLFFVMLLTGGLLLREPDFGAFAVITVIAMGILFLGGMNWRLFAGLIVMLIIGFLVLIAISPYRMQRVVGFMDPWADPYGKGYQLSHALIAFGRGEWLGVGLGGSVEKLFYLPEAHTDFLLAVIAEELGFAGVALIICMFAWMVARALRSAARRGARTLFRSARRAGDRPVDRRAGDHQHGREHGHIADKRPHAAFAFVRRQRARVDVRRARDPAAHRLGKQATRKRVDGVRVQLLLQNARRTNGCLFR